MELWAFVACWVAGLLLMFTAVVMIVKGRFVIDKETNQPIEIDLPLGMKLKSNTPVLAILLIAAGLVVYPATRIEPMDIKLKPVRSNISSPVATKYKAYAVLDESTQDTGGQLQRASMRLPALAERRYRVYYFPEGGPLLRSESFYLDGPEPEHVLQLDIANAPAPGNQADTARSLGNITAEARREPDAVLGEFTEAGR